MTAQRVVKGILYAHGTRVFAFLDTEQPYDVPGTAALMRRAQEVSAGPTGTVKVKMVEDENFPNTQGFAVLAQRAGISRARFAEAVVHLFPSCKLEMRWVTSFDQGDNALLWGLIAHSVLARL